MITRTPLTGTLVLCALTLAATAASGQRPGQATPHPDYYTITLTAHSDATGDNQADPGYEIYKEGYALVLEEKWDQAREKFRALIAKYPKSEYVDDARYWSAYSLKHSNRKAAVEAYTKFIQQHARSRYYDDAVADLNDLQPGAVGGTGTVPVYIERTPGPHAYSVAPIPPMRNLERQLRRQMRQLGRVGIGHPSVAPFVIGEQAEKLDPSTRLKMDALYALGETREDEKSYTTLKDVALDMKQPRPLREAAMDALSNFAKYDVLSVFVEIARMDTNRDIQGYAIDYIGEHGADKNQRVGVLEELYRVLPKSRSDQRQTIVYTIADVGNDRAVDFLKNVALSDEDFELRRDAVYYLGNIGGDRARSALYEILKGK
ncbi:MAG: HEAT repeat domain-containing protein [Bacteroidota bacterium]